MDLFSDLTSEDFWINPGPPDKDQFCGKTSLKVFLRITPLSTSRFTYHIYVLKILRSSVGKKKVCQALFIPAIDKLRNLDLFSGGSPPVQWIQFSAHLDADERTCSPVSTRLEKLRGYCRREHRVCVYGAWHCPWLQTSLGVLETFSREPGGCCPALMQPQ